MTTWGDVYMKPAVESERIWPNVFTPATLAEWWGCSENHIRNLIKSGELHAFAVGGKLLRIRPEDVEAFECQTGGSQGSRANGASLGTSQVQEQYLGSHPSTRRAGTSPSLTDDATGLEPRIIRKQPAAPLLSTARLRVLQGQR